MAYNNAGIQVPPCPLTEETAEGFDAGERRQPARRLDLHEARADTDARQGSGAIVNCSSLGGLVGLPGRAAYHASKHGVIGLTKSAALELRRGAFASTLFARAASPRPWATKSNPTR